MHNAPRCRFLFFVLAQGYGDSDFANLREATCGSMLTNPTCSSQRGGIGQGDRVEEPDGGGMSWSSSCTSKREIGIGDSVQSQEAHADIARFRRVTCSTSTRAGNVGVITASDSLAIDSCPRTPMKAFRQQISSPDWSGDVPATPTAYTTSTLYPCTPKAEVTRRTIDRR